ncbi:MAG: hypothetical protein NZ772_17065 [Cyanobacteria bacterium]|nr:hypothetical protein [Cyanobacteriota bacterium]MDW8202187.1 hypothetical protein [Cyanobacteriota bacterium SKYGB_h_bin112]
MMTESKHLASDRIKTSPSQIIVRLLSQHRQPGQPALPATLRKTQVLSLLRQSVQPDYPEEQLRQEVQMALQSLEDQGELLRATGNQYCVAPPSLLATSPENFVGLRFRGDRAYLPLAHTILKTQQPPTEEKLHPKLVSFERAKERLQAKRIRLLTLDDLVSELPMPEKPWRSSLSPYELSLEQTELQCYCPAYAEQDDRWQQLDAQLPQNESLLRKLENANGKDYQYFWFVANQFYVLYQDAAIYAIFYLDRREQQPLRLVLDQNERLNLKTIWLPYAYHRWCQQFLEPCEGERRVYQVPPTHKSLVRVVFQRLGCNCDLL